MAELENPEKSAGITAASAEQPMTAARPAGWMYKQLSIGPFSLGWYASPRFQLGLVAFVCFMCPGMFNALSGLGGGGRESTGLADNMVAPHPYSLSSMFICSS